MKLGNATVPGVALEAGAEEVLADEITQQVKIGLSADPGVDLRAIER